MYTTPCKSTQQRLSALHDGALSPWQTWRLRAHLQHCADCRNEYAGLQRLHSLLLAGDLLPEFAPERLQTETQPASTAPTDFTRAVRVYPKRRIASRVLGGLAAASVVIFGLLYLPHQKDPGKPSPLSASAQVRRALANINTWHLKGWIVQNGERVPWEVWGRRQPFFYREQIGPDIIVDNGKQRVSLYAPFRDPKYRTDGRNYTTHEKNYLRPGVALILPSHSEAVNVRWSYQRMVDHWQPGINMSGATPEDLIFTYGVGGILNPDDGPDSFTSYVCTVSKRSWLPRLYEIQRGKMNTAEPRTLTAHLDITYDVPIPQKVSALPAAPANYVTYDSRRTPPVAASRNVVTRGGVTVELQALATDAEGNVLIKARGWIGDTLFGKDSPLLIGLGLMDTASNYTHSSIPRRSYDDQGRAYIEISWYPLSSGNPDDTTSLMLWTPMEPIPADAPRPDHLKVHLNVALAIESRMRATMDMHDQCLLQQEMEIPITLPAAGEPMEKQAAAFLDTESVYRWNTERGLESLESMIYLWRLGSYRNLSFHKGKIYPEMRERYQYWAERYIPVGVSTMVQDTRLGLANSYVGSGNRKRAIELLYDVLNEPRFRDIPTLVKTSPRYTEEARRRWRDSVARARAEVEGQARIGLQSLGEPIK
jgi:hypothetical protein